MIILGSAALVGCGGEVDSPLSADPSQSLAQRAGAPLFEGMGDYHMPITTADPDAQRYFDQGMVLAFGFNHAESIRSFRAAQTLDPGCAMCFWGEALATGPNINVTSNGKAIMAPAERASARAAIDQALALMNGARRYARSRRRPVGRLIGRPFAVTAAVAPACTPSSHFLSRLLSLRRRPFVA